MSRPEYRPVRTIIEGDFCVCVGECLFLARTKRFHGVGAQRPRIVVDTEMTVIDLLRVCERACKGVTQLRWDESRIAKLFLRRQVNQAV